VGSSLKLSEKEDIGKVLESALSWAQQQAYLEYTKHDALNSPAIRALFGGTKFTRLLAIQAVMRFPINIRPLLLVRRSINPKGLALFARALFDYAKVSGDASHSAEALRLCDWLIEVRDGGKGWGYHYAWQDLGFYAPSRTPNAVVTSFVCEALMDAYVHTGSERYAFAVRDAIGFFENDLPRLKETKEELCVGYMPMPMSMRVMDVSVLIGAAMARYVSLTGHSDCAVTAERLVTYVVRRQTEYGAWFYTDPSGGSPIRHDNYHTGFILDALNSYMHYSNSDQFKRSYDAGLAFYAKQLFNADGAPRWMSDRDYPHDIHGSAQGIITFARHEQEFPGLARKIASWAIENLYSGQGYFYYQQRRYYTTHFTFLRWCNAWMARALATLLRAELTDKQGGV